MKKTVFIATIIYLLTACTSVDTETISEIEEWQEKLDSAHQVFSKTDFEFINKIAWDVNENEKAIKILNDSDTIYTDMVKKLDDYKWIRKKLKHIDAKKYEYEIEFSELKQQLDNLKLDVQNGVRTSEENQQYLSNEISAIKELFAKFSHDHGIFEKAISEYKRLNGSIQEYVDQLKREKGVLSK